MRGERLVLLHAEGPEVPERRPAEQGGRRRVLEGNRRRQEDHVGWGSHRPPESARLLHGQAAEGRQDQLDHARVQSRFFHSPSSCS
ncbi:unnamed protein product [Linum tenue]|uniref:Uncharacterized protein n=1 Tax=Linum tenue TaxID=586396 RepID=A0AAV0L2L3_9ROSI|nr:unnamed protein product [Linum tenue]